MSRWGEVFSVSTFIIEDVALEVVHIIIADVFWIEFLLIEFKPIEEVADIVCIFIHSPW